MAGGESSQRDEAASGAAAAAEALAALRARIGEEVGVSDWITIDQQMIDRFADLTGDPQFIHTDPERAARETPFGGTIAHGFLTLSLASAFALDALPPRPGQRMGINYGFERVRFLTPVPAGSRVRGRFTLLAAELRDPRTLQFTHRLTVEIAGAERPALVADWIGLAVF